MARTNVKNISNGPRGFRTTSGFVSLEAGQVLEDAEFEEAELNSAKGTGFFEFSKAKGEKVEVDPNDLTKKTVAELQELAKAETIDLGEATKKDDIVSAIETARAAKAQA